MAKNKQPSSRSKTSISAAVKSKDEIRIHEAIIAKYAKVLDMTDSGRDIKPLATGLFEAMDRLKALRSSNGEAQKETPLFKILNKAAANE